MHPKCFFGFIFQVSDAFAHFVIFVRPLSAAGSSRAAIGCSSSSSSSSSSSAETTNDDDFYNDNFQNQNMRDEIDNSSNNFQNQMTDDDNFQIQNSGVYVHRACSMCKSLNRNESLRRVRRCVQPPTAGSRALAAKADVVSRSCRGDSTRPSAFPCTLHQCPVNALRCKYMMSQVGSSMFTESTALGPMRAQSRTSISISLLQQRVT